VDLIAFEQLGIALLLGLLVGLQREHVHSGVVGVRTFPLITVLGTVAAMLGTAFGGGGWIVAAGLLGLVAVLIAAYRVRSIEAEAPDRDIGITTEVAAVLMYGVGALLVVMPREVAIAVGGGVAILLQFKPELHSIARRLGDDDLKAVMQFVLITCIVLPVLPDRTFGPLDVLNPFETWLLVVLIVGVGLGGYIAYKFLGPSAGVMLGGLLGGAISSTATTVSYARQSRQQATLADGATAVILIASGVAFVRILILMAVIAPEFAVQAAIPFGVLAVLTLAPALLVWRRMKPDAGPMPEQRNPTQLRSAVLFGLIYAVVLLALAAAKRYFSSSGSEALYAVAALSGLTDMDAIALSTARLSREDAVMIADGWRLVVAAGMTNLIAKAVLAAALGDRRLACRVAAFLAVPLVGGALLLWLI